MDETTILLADDDQRRREGVLRLLMATSKRYFVRRVDNGQDAWLTLSEQRPHVFIGAAILDRGPGGAELCGRIRRAAELHCMGVVLLAAEGDREARSLSLRRGADLVVSRGELPRVLPHELPSLVERARGRWRDRLQYRGLLLCVESGRAWIGDRALDLSPALIHALHCLLSNPHDVHSYHALTGSSWSVDRKVARGRANLLIHRLKKKLDEEHRDFIESVHSVGYRLRMERDEV